MKLVGRLPAPDIVLQDLQKAYREGSERFPAMLWDAKTEGYSNAEILKHVFRNDRDSWGAWLTRVRISPDPRGPREVVHGKASTYARGCLCGDCWRARDRYMQMRKAIR